MGEFNTRVDTTTVNNIYSCFVKNYVVKSLYFMGH